MKIHPLVRSVAHPGGARFDGPRTFARWSVMAASVFALPVLIPSAVLAQPHEGERGRERVEERHEQRQEQTEERRDDRKERHEEKRDDRHDNRVERREDRHDHRAGGPPAMGGRPAAPAVAQPGMVAPAPRPFAPGARGPASGPMGVGAPVMRGAPPAGSGPGRAPVMRGAPPTAPRPYHPRFAPPPPIVENPAQRPGFVWAGGYYDWADDHYLWVNGHYEPERRDSYWSPPRWELQGGLFSWLPGGWISITTGPSVAPPPPPPEPVMQPRPGFVWIPGYQEWRGNQYVWVPGTWQTERPNEQWHPGRWERHGNHWVWHRGGWHRH